MKGFTANAEDAGHRLDVYIRGKFTKFTRSSLETLFDRGLVKVGGQPAKASYKLKTGDKIAVDDKMLKAKRSKINLPVIYENHDVLVVDKPAGILSHSKGALNLETTVADFIRPKISSELSGNRAGIVHRLDRATSGVMITAKNGPALKWLQRQFSQRNAIKTYLAVVEGNLKPKEAIIEAPISRNPKKPQTFMVSAAGKPAISRYRLLKTFTRDGNDYSLAELQPQTGRTHQLRVHMAYASHPVVGDSVYGNTGRELMLHASRLEITLPGGARKVFQSNSPERIKDFIDGR